MFAADCTDYYNSTELVYFLEVSCSADLIYILGESKFTFSKKNVGVILVSADILIVLTLFCMLSFQGWNESRVCEEIEEAEVMASRYTVEIRNIPQEGGQVRSAKYKSQMWQWIEGVCYQFQKE
jgi:hypothetical protein